MATKEPPLPVETLPPFQQNRSPATISALQNVASQQGPQRNSQSPDSIEEDEASSNEKPKRQKRSRACVACRNMKIRCLPVEGQEACSGCAKVNRPCIMPGPPRKRQKTVHKVAELEKKINALTDALLAKGQQQTDTPPTDDSPDNQQASTNSDTSITSMDSRQQKVIEKVIPTPATPELKAPCRPYTVEPIARDTYVDVIERGDLTMESASAMFNYWMHEMSQTCAMVVFPPGTEAQDIRTRRPMTFLTILSIASPVIQPSANQALATETNRQLSERILFHGEKSLDLIQAALLNSQYYTRPASARDLSFNQYIHSAILMSLELGIGKRSKVDRSLTPAQDLERRRTWLACYQAGTMVSTVLRLPSFVKFNSHLDECLDTLSKSPYALPSDKWLCATIGLQRIAEEVAVAFHMDDPGADLNFTEPRVQYQLRLFQRQLQQWETSLDPSLDRRIAQHQANTLKIYTHEVAIHFEHNVDDFRPGEMAHAKLPDFVTSRHAEALSILLECSHRVLDNYISLDLSYARTLPNLYVVWNAYAMVVLIKIHWIVNNPDSTLGAVFAPELKTDFYLDALLNRLAEVSADGHSPCAEAFGLVVKKLKFWHLHRGNQFSDDEQGPDDESRRPAAAEILRKDPVSIIGAAKNTDDSKTGLTMRPFTPAMLPGQWNVTDRLGSNLNAAYDAASYGNTNWDQFNFSTEELDLFDVYMNNSGWMGYLL
ncbi:uncharacterized protein Z518_09345 [Rhinocladiella mackenziei CBS 650.93]|uniref:Zn(2)-C6 fungal-type domain-containing protein n=1 Tax=Rhinocladiella mackenziei CBS 650.93 TaxID=1442369 RepID=A0A0D2I722_9EURO|nr:uncharacterized protein Z518_09345 [Rhinocladiella mackenziei CBS 650.93]KIX01619.1 hypothetical protein Z518_09345 [Rhinocladiella mackenziei CBS 650.93]